MSYLRVRDSRALRDARRIQDPVLRELAIKHLQEKRAERKREQEAARG